MEARHRKLVVLVLIALGVGARPSPAAQDGTAKGVLSLNSATVELTHAYAVAQSGFFDKTAEDIRVLVSDVALPEKARAEIFDLIHLGREGKARAVEVVLNSAGQPISGAIFAPEFEGMVSVAGIHHFEAQHVERGRVAGRLSMDGPRTFAGVTFRYEVTFSAAIPRPPTAEETAAALASPPARAAAAHLSAIRDGRFPAFLDTLTSSAAADYRGPDGPDRLAELRAGTPADSHVASLIRTTDTIAVATIEGSRDGIVIEFTLNLVLEARAWKVGK